MLMEGPRILVPKNELIRTEIKTLDDCQKVMEESGSLPKINDQGVLCKKFDDVQAIQSVVGEMKLDGTGRYVHTRVTSYLGPP